MIQSVELPFGLTAIFAPGQAAVVHSGLHAQFLDGDDDVGSKAAATALAFESVVLALLAAGYDLGSEAGRAALETAAQNVANRL